nr:MAG TPA: hypothetical protein [Caudoviricetes sp.]
MYHVDYKRGPCAISPEVVQLPSPATQRLADGGIPIPSHDRLLPEVPLVSGLLHAWALRGRYFSSG